MRTLIQPFCVALALLCSSSTWAQQAPIGHLKRLAGTVSVEHDGHAQEATAGTPLYPGNCIRTGPDGHAGTTLVDDTPCSPPPPAACRCSTASLSTPPRRRASWA